MSLSRSSAPFITLIVVTALLVSAAPAVTRAATCVFSAKNLELGVVSEEVRCLQKYLNSAGFTVSDSGVGSVGRETHQYQTKTQAAVARWQAANGVSATGTWGPLSRAKYIVLTSGTSPVTPPPTTPVVTPPAATTQQEGARTAILGVRGVFDSAVKEYNTAKDDRRTVGKAQTYLTTAQSKLLEALYAFVSGNYAKTVTDVGGVTRSVNDALNEIDTKKKNSSSSKSATRTEAKDALKDAQDAIDDAWDDIDQSKSSSSRIRKAEDAMARAEKLYTRAESSYNDKYYDEVMDYVDDLLDLVDDALDVL